MKNTRNDIEVLATAESVTLAGASLGNDANAIEQIKTAISSPSTYQGNDDNFLEDVTP